MNAETVYWTATAKAVSVMIALPLILEGLQYERGDGLLDGYS